MRSLPLWQQGVTSLSVVLALLGGGGKSLHPCSAAGVILMQDCHPACVRREGEAGRPGSAGARNAAAAGPVQHEGTYVAFLAAHDLEASDSDDASFRRAPILARSRALCLRGGVRPACGARSCDELAVHVS
jgi:hypothetical protein